MISEDKRAFYLSDRLGSLFIRSIEEIGHYYTNSKYLSINLPIQLFENHSNSRSHKFNINRS